MADVVRSSGPEEDPRDGTEGTDSGHRDAAGDGSRRRGRDKKKGSFWRELPLLIVIALVLTVLIQAFLARVYVIPSQSMEQTLHGCPGCNNDRVLVDKVSYRFSEPEPGDVVVFRGPDTWNNDEFETEDPTNPVAKLLQGAASLVGLGAPDEKDFVKRIIATEGQTVSCCSANNEVMVDGKPLHEPYVYWEPGRGTVEKPFAPVTVPPGHLWVMGDNRNDSADSRFQGGGGVRGAVPVDNVVGKAQVIVLPPSRWSSIDDPNPQAQALGAPAWQRVIPLGAGFAAAVPTLWAGRRLRAALVRRGVREQR